MTDSATDVPPLPNTGRTGEEGGETVLRPPSNPVNRRAIGWWLTRALLTVVPPVLVLGLLALLIAPARPWLLLSAAVVGVPGLVYAVVMPPWRYRMHRWEMTRDALFTRAGWVREQWWVAPMARIQTAHTIRGPLQRMFRLSTVVVTTASAAGPLKIDGLDYKQAWDLVDELGDVAQTETGDAA
ncbi:PH domain-containing protein [Streptomyces sp. NPDC003077]|uniref:PH domain-containing protein n=1 Tax=Streptomyces sp. NPDC003077 TaxID=3154443 RepID=UPI0033BB482A